MAVFISHSENDTKKFALELLKKHFQGGIFCLYGDLGSGKTVFSKGLALGLGIPEKKIKSPTFTLIRAYHLTAKNTSARPPHYLRQNFSAAPKTFYHCDFYRIQQPDDLIVCELAEIFAKKNAIIAIEWPNRIEKFLPKKRLNLYFEYKNERTRSISHAII